MQLMSTGRTPGVDDGHQLTRHRARWCLHIRARDFAALPIFFAGLRFFCKFRRTCHVSQDTNVDNAHFPLHFDSQSSQSARLRYGFVDVEKMSIDSVRNRSTHVQTNGVEVQVLL